MSKPGKVLKELCKRLGVRLTVKRGKKRVYKSVAVLKRQCVNKKKRRTRKYGKALLPKLRKISKKNVKHVYKLKDPHKKRILAIDEGIRAEAKKTGRTMKKAAIAKKARFNVLRIYRKNRKLGECNKLTRDMRYIDKKYKLGKTKNICKRKRRRKFGTTSSVENNNLSRKQYIFIGKENPEEGAMSMYEPVETIYGYGSFDRNFIKSKGTMLHENSFVDINNISTIYNEELIPIYNERPYIKADQGDVYRIEELGNVQREGFKKFDYDIEGHNFNWYVFNPFNDKGLKNEKDKISKIEGYIRNKRKRKKHGLIIHPIRITKRTKRNPQEESNQPPPSVEMGVQDVSDYDSEYDYLEFGKKRRKKVKKRRTRKKINYKREK
tara:strand:- start:1806 stop:2945 length:1140 start_codon:yes stop_codon:yes gene_type:complete